MAHHGHRQSHPDPQTSRYRVAQVGVMVQFLIRFRWNLFSQLALLMMALAAFVAGLGGMIRGAEMSAFLPAALPAVLLGWLFARRNIKPWQALGGLAFFGIGLIWLRTAKITMALLVLAYNIPLYLFQAARYLHGSSLPQNGDVLLLAYQNITSQSLTVWIRITAWFQALLAGQGTSFNDPVVKILVWSVLIWILAIWAGWAAGRDSVFAGLFPCLVLLAAVTKYTKGDIAPLWVMAVSMTILFSVTHLDTILNRWRTQGVDYAEMITANTIFPAVGLVFVMAALGWAVSMVSLKDLMEAWRKPANENQVAVSLGLEPARETKSPGSASPATTRPAGLPNNHLLGSGPELSKEVFFTVRTGELPPVPPSITPSEAAPRHYWRSSTFDIYTGSGWLSSTTENLTYTSNQPIYPVPPDYQVLQQSFNLRTGQNGLMYWSGNLYRSSLPFDVSWRVKPGQNIPMAVDPFQGADLYGAINSGTAYQVDSLVRPVSVEQLRAAGRDIPDFIVQRYTYLPMIVPERVYNLARELTSSSATPYDEVMAIEHYVRTNYTYTLDVPLPPPGMDVADNFLFELKKGYCDYYATAMAVMVRSIGLPARLVTGFAPGVYNFESAEYTVTAADAHSWVEVYFAGVGWVEFEPTAGEPEIILPENLPADLLPQQNVAPQWERIVRSMYSIPQSARWVFVGFGILILFVVAAFLLEGWILQVINQRTALGWMYRSIYRQGKRFTGLPDPGETTSEFVELLQSSLQQPLKGLDELSHFYQRAMYGPGLLAKEDVQGAIRIWRKLRWRLMFARKKK